LVNITKGHYGLFFFVEIRGRKLIYKKSDPWYNLFMVGGYYEKDN